MDTFVVIFITTLSIFSMAFGTIHEHEALELHGVHPTFLASPTSYTVDAGQVAKLECAVENLDDKQVIWRKTSDPNPLTVGEESFYNNDRIVVDHKLHSNNWDLVIRQVRLTDAGVYECQVSTKYRNLRQQVLLTVREIPTNTTTVPRPHIQITGPQFVEKNGLIYLICNATGLEHTPDELDWFFNGNKLSTQENKKVTIRNMVSITSKTIASVLEIADAQIEDGGLYVCRTSNLQIISLRVSVLNADSFPVKRGNSDKKRKDKDELGQHAEHSYNTAHASVRHRHLLTSVLSVLLTAMFCLHPS
ncbi:leucine-rich repeats and immunoglobulin-like domains protein 1 isoform X2 [Physella acuta]|uniref:leucine-rich repeats and immunoglobulin-like domains protein 1 isoform X2 n=1 Tax=Physella acuta TaxID=109671 RepID=UPI0027DADD97|nr:leucine-rich repeats and immunoglobulin-like domains protein 1 isoform X2 [Physella acuta]